MNFFSVQPQRFSLNVYMRHIKIEISGENLFMPVHTATPCMMTWCEYRSLFNFNILGVFMGFCVLQLDWCRRKKIENRKSLPFIFTDKTSFHSEEISNIHYVTFNVVSEAKVEAAYVNLQATSLRSMTLPLPTHRNALKNVQSSLTLSRFSVFCFEVGGEYKNNV